MRTKKNVWTRSLAMLLFLAMMLGVTPIMPSIVQEAEAAAEGTSFISMPITIRDYAADGMLFEFNQVGATGTGGAVSTTYSIYAINGSNKNVTSGIHVYTHGNYGWEYSSVWNLCIICDASGKVVKVIPNGTSKGDVNANTGVYYDTMKSGYYSVWVNTATADAYATLNSINDTNKGKYTLTYSGSTLTLTTSGSGYNQGDTAGFSMLATTDNDYIKNLTDSSSIAGTTLLQNGSWGLKTDPAAVSVSLNSGATQQVYGAWIRTDLVQPKLVNGEIVYTEAAVKYIAEYMQQIMPVPWRNSDGTYNTYHVQGHKLSELGGTDLATKIRAEVTGGLGTYASAKAKFDAGNLNEYTQIETWYDAAYFLLHNIFNDNTGYGKTVDAYKNLELIQTTNANGETCYVFNSGYDDAVYDYTNGVIYNTQTAEITAAKNSEGGDAYVRGNKLPEARFDPLGKSGANADLGYGQSGDIYGDLITASTADWAEYYDNTNYNLSLEGHAQFIYYEDSNLYFTFTGDDDVYLYINGIRVLDVGAAHSISKVSINLNDVAEMCGLADGEAYDFDFFYMERHGTAANFGIETNIKIVDPAMTTTKEGFQNGISTGYNGYVDPLVPVYYSFSLKNNGEAPIEDLTFTDDDIGVSLSKNNITLNAETLKNREKVGAIVYNADGSTKSHTDNITDDALKALLDGELAVGEEIIVYGFRYTIPADVWDAGNSTFSNTVYTTAIGVGDNAGQNLNGMADWKVQEREYSIQDYHVYEWVGKSVTLTKDELLQPLVDKVVGFVKDSATIAVSSASGATTGVNVNTKAVLNSDGSITYTGTETGADIFYYKVNEGTVEAVIGVAVYSYDVADNTYVLDYGLSVELNGDDFGLRVNDTLTLADNPNATTAKVTGIQNETYNYGTFTWADPSLKYTPNDIIDNTDSVQANVQVLEDGATELTKFTGVAMYETITTAPANVVYYEENFPGITYVNEGENQWAHYETVDEDGNSVAGTEQSADQDANYGSDPNYEADVIGKLEGNFSTVKFNLDTSDLNQLQEEGIAALNDYLGLEGSSLDSNGTVNELVVKETAEVMYFDFAGTGVEIISRTTADQYAVINVQVRKYHADGTYTDADGSKYDVIAQKPVITESIGGTMYQIPVISITGLDWDEYRVVVKAVGNTDGSRVLYIDGIRIYGALDYVDKETGESPALEYYNPEEYQAEFLEIKQLIKEGKMLYADISDTDDKYYIVTGTTMIEDEEGFGILTSIEDVDIYMTLGPNNELYMDGNMTANVVAFFLTPIEDYPEEARTIEVGAHRVADMNWEDYGSVYMQYGKDAESIYTMNNQIEVASGTEMYYTIDVKKLSMDEQGRYLVLIGAYTSDIYTYLSLTNLKIAGYEISFAQSEIFDDYIEGVENPASLAMFTPINENLEITAAAFKASKVVSGKLANLTVKATYEAVDLLITDADGNEIPEEDITRFTSKVGSDGTVTYNIIWKVYGSRGDVLEYNIRAYDADGYASVNEETLSITIK